MSLPNELLPVGLLGTGAANTGYLIERSLRFNSSDSAYLSRTPASAGNRKTWTWAGWVKRSALGSRQTFFSNLDAGASLGFLAEFTSGDALDIYDYSTTYQARRTTTQVFRDASAWYHILIQYDSTNSIAANRLRLYVNGAQVTAFSNSTDPTLNADGTLNTAVETTIGRSGAFASLYFNGYLADVHFIDGQALTPSSFGEFSATTGRWEPKKYSGPTPAGNSFWLPFSDNSAATATTLGKDGFLLGNNWSCNNIQVASSSTTNWTSRTSISSGAIWGWSYLSQLFDASTATGPHSGAAITYSFSPGIPASGSLRLNIGCNVYHDPNVMINVSINGAGYGTFPGAVAWRTIGWAGGTINSITLQGTNSGNTQALETFFNAIEVNGVQLIDNAAAQNDSLVDTPTSGSQVDTGLGGQVTGNYAVMNPLANRLVTLANGNLDLTRSSGESNSIVYSTIAVSSGKWYAEMTAGSDSIPGISLASAPLTTYSGGAAGSYGYYQSGLLFANGNTTSYGASFTSGDVIGVALNLDAGTLTFYKNGVSQGTAASSLSGTFVFTGRGSANSTPEVWNFGQRPWAYQAPANHRPLVDTLLPAPVVAKSSDYFQTVLYTGNGSTQTVGNLQFSPDLVWVKSRSAGNWHTLTDTVRGAGYALQTNVTNAEIGDGTWLINGLTSNGFSVNMNPNGTVNDNGTTYAAWCWDAGSSTVTNTQGSITSSVRANASAGFSIVTYTGNGTSGATIGHGLGVAPSFIIHKCRSDAANWFVYHRSAGNGAFEGLNTTAAYNAGSGAFGSTAPTSTVLTTGGDTNTNGRTYVDYCFAPVAGYSSFGSYTGNGSTTDNTFVYTGMRPRFVMLKRSDSTGNWVIWDAVRNSYNVANSILLPNSSAAEFSPDAKIDILSNGFKVRDNSSDSGTNGATYIYAAFAESPLAYSRAR